jgi:hypothetical protein
VLLTNWAITHFEERLAMQRSGLLRTARRLAIGLCGLMMATGCNSGTQRQAVEGWVTLDGQPLKSGNIKFQPEGGTHGPNAGATIEAGKFHIDTTRGTFAGEFRVEITASRPTSRMITDRDGKQVPDQEQFLPKKYNSESILRAGVRPDVENKFTFELSSR